MNRLRLLAFSVLAAAALIGCSRSEVRVETSTPTRTTPSVAPQPTFVATSAGGSPPAAPPTPAAGAARLVALDGTRCIGQWRNAAQGTSGAFAAHLEAGGSGGAIRLEVGGPVFGGSGGTFEAPFRLADEAMRIEAHSEWLGHMSARIGLDGTATGTLQAIPALGPRSLITASDYSLANNRLAFTLRIEPGDGRPTQTSRVEAACSR